MPLDQDSLSYLSIGSLGTGFGEESLERGLAMGIDFIGADAGSVDGGPSALAGGPPAWSDAVPSSQAGFESAATGGASVGPECPCWSGPAHWVWS